MEVRSWVIKIGSRNVLNRLIEMVQKQELEEIFLCQVIEDDAVLKGFRKNDIIAMLSSDGLKIKPKLSAMGECVLLDDLDDTMFDLDDEGAALKGVLYPESEEEELKMVELLK
ncbi:hypothetical protein KKE54_05580 [bacterium]|nr:hypothetical protein [bacterium]